MVFKWASYYIQILGGSPIVVDGWVNIDKNIGIRKADGYWGVTDLMTGLLLGSACTKKDAMNYDLTKLEACRGTIAYRKKCDDLYNHLPPPQLAPKYETAEEQKEREALLPVNGRR